MTVDTASDATSLQFEKALAIAESELLSFSEMAWRDEPVQNFFFEGLFVVPATREIG
jgi:hypothetical protein